MLENRLNLPCVFADVHGVEMEAFCAVQRDCHFFKKEYGIPVADDHNTIKIIFLGRLDPDKGWRWTISILPDLNLLLHNCIILVAGQGSMEDEIRAAFKKHQIHAYFLGRIPPQNVPALLVHSDIHVTTSARETLGLTVLEAAAAGIPVIAPRAFGCKENIQDGETGLLYSPQNKLDFLSKLEFIIHNRDQRERMGRQARELVSCRTWENGTQSLVDFWQSVIKNHPKPPQITEHLWCLWVVWILGGLSGLRRKLVQFAMVGAICTAFAIIRAMWFV